MKAETGVPEEEPERRASPCLLSLVIPTRNESANAPLLVKKLSEVLAGLSYEVIVVDDSDDETPRILPAIAAKSGLNLLVLHRLPTDRSGGLSTAVIQGFQAAQGEYAVIMDADLQHPPELILPMLSRATETDAQVVVASRYIPGGSNEGLNGRSRRFISFASKWLVKILFFDRLYCVTDPLSGFFAVRRTLLEETQLRAIGFKILLDILVRSGCSRVEELPLKFQRRSGGSSKATLKQGRDFLAHTVMLFWETRLGQVRRAVKR